MRPTPIGSVLGLRDACEHGDAELSRNEANGGIGIWCLSCRNWVTRQKGFDRVWLGKEHPELRGIDLAALPLIRSQIYRKCQGPCAGLKPCELHHLAPRAFLGDECDQWPTAWLCKMCHERWHSRVTPGLCTAYDPAAHARQLLDYLGLERGAELTRALTTIGKARRAQGAA